MAAPLLAVIDTVFFTINNNHVMDTAAKFNTAIFEIETALESVNNRPTQFKLDYNVQQPSAAFATS